MQDAPRLPVLIAGGLHSEARRTVVEALLRTVAGSAALHHELSRAGLCVLCAARGPDA